MRVSMDYQCVRDGMKAKKKKPIELVIDKIGVAVAAENIPKKWHVVGKVLLLQHDSLHRLDEKQLKCIGEAFLSVVKGVDSVCVELISPNGELRVPKMVLVAGKEDTLTMHVEDKVRYHIDPRKVMFSSGNGTERMHFRHNVDMNDGDVVVDMFCGIGYFTIPLAISCREKNQGNVKIYALEKNPDSCEFLRMNVKENKVSHIVTVLEGDNREIGDEVLGKASRVLMGYIPTPVSFIDRAVSFLTKQGIIHYHYVCKEAEKESTILDHFKHIDKKKILAVRQVKSYAPQLYHYVADIEIEK